jgi:hypothetical protein
MKRVSGKRFTLVINNETVAATHFAWDGCHKIYLIKTASDRSLMDSYGWESGAYHPIWELPQAWEDSCSLRFISWADLTLPNLVNQFDENATVEVKVGA